MSHERLDDLKRFYAVLDELGKNFGGARQLTECSGRMNWPQRGIYFFQEAGECGFDTGSDRRIVRVGTHALKTGSGTKLWTRLSQHRGPAWILLKKVEASCDRYLIAGGGNVEAEWEQGPAV